MAAVVLVAGAVVDLAEAAVVVAAVMAVQAGALVATRVREARFHGKFFPSQGVSHAVSTHHA